MSFVILKVSINDTHDELFTGPGAAFIKLGYKSFKNKDSCEDSRKQTGE